MNTCSHVKTADLYAEAAQAGIPERTLKRANSDLLARSHRQWDPKADRGPAGAASPSLPLRAPRLPAAGTAGR